jgi:hypothetical protein
VSCDSIVHYIVVHLQCMRQIDVSRVGRTAAKTEASHGSSGPEWLAVLGRIGGRNSSAAKAAAARRNGRKGGRPRTRSRKDSVES